MQTLNTCLVCREEAGISQLTFSKCHKEGEMQGCNLCVSVKTSQLGGGMWKLHYFIEINSSLVEFISLFSYLESLKIQTQYFLDFIIRQSINSDFTVERKWITVFFDNSTGLLEPLDAVASEGEIHLGHVRFTSMFLLIENTNCFLIVVSGKSAFTGWFFSRAWACSFSAFISTTGPARCILGYFFFSLLSGKHQCHFEVFI